MKDKQVLTHTTMFFENKIFKNELNLKEISFIVFSLKTDSRLCLPFHVLATLTKQTFKTSSKIEGLVPLDLKNYRRRFSK